MNSLSNSVTHHLSAKDSILKQVIAEVDWPKIISTGNVFHDLMSCIVEQQIHYRSTKKTFAKLLAKASSEELTVDNFAEFEEQALGDVKLSMKKYETIIEVVAFFQEHSPDWSGMSNAEVREVLGSIKGIGPWTIDMILLYTLERPNVFPAQDYHLRLVIEQLYSVDAKRITSEMKKIAKNWAPYQSFGVKYLLAWKEANKRRKQ
ncbi:DNA-3-methyladenine glycosylase family protein [Tunicatimonas pelagia]|uniref:DNA-3-methyladenine glycosylase family protein n=1 Tax=Tunicatimonas pelagia TaxID=931531 RepID=UPI0026653A71|nr:hypothetical protein [Tunicatimonas pelagia]WKN45656.1 hypothetical protein P0M28_11880 [Tunicatimonas pelagia]